MGNDNQQVVQVIIDKTFTDLIDRELKRLHEHYKTNPQDTFVQTQMKELHTKLANFLEAQTSTLNGKKA